MKKSILITTLFIFAVATMCVSVVSDNSVEFDDYSSPIPDFKGSFQFMEKNDPFSDQSNIIHGISGYFGPINEEAPFPTGPAVGFGYPD